MLHHRRFRDSLDCMGPLKMVKGYHKPESGRHNQIGACGHWSEARSSVAERCRYMAEEGVRILPRLPGRPVEWVNELWSRREFPVAGLFDSGPGDRGTVGGGLLVRRRAACRLDAVG